MSQLDNSCGIYVYPDLHNSRGRLSGGAAAPLALGLLAVLDEELQQRYTHDGFGH